ncbi:MAG: hemolysin D [Bacteroidetes bacterium]|nr:MAG: hemolysin D [Bacteroidota bacterium]
MSTSSSLPSSAFKQELANSLSHGLGLLFGLVSIPILIGLAAARDFTEGIVGASIFGFGFLMVYAFSTLYHSLPHPRIKRVMRIMDHISIYFLIAGSYTPFVLAYMLDGMGITLLAILWGLTLAGVIFKLLFTGRFDKLSTGIYLGMGWLLLAVIKPFFERLPGPVLIMLAIGGLMYTLGVIFYRWHKLPYHHAIWHGFVLAGSICHYVAVLLVVADPA